MKRSGKVSEDEILKTIKSTISSFASGTFLEIAEIPKDKKWAIVVAQLNKTSRVLKTKIENLENKDQIHQNENMDLILENQRSDLALEGSGVGAWDWWLRTNKVSYDRRWCEMLGLNFKETPQTLSTWDNLIHPEDKEKVYRDIGDYLEGKTDVYENIHRLKHRNGSWVWILDRGKISEIALSGEAIRFTGTHFDITKYKETDALLEDLQRMGKIGGWELDLASGMQTWTTETYRIYGIPIGTPVDKKMGISFYPPHEQKRIHECVDRCIRGEKFDEILEFVDSLGNLKWVAATGEPVYDANSEIRKIRGTFQDITERKKIEIELAKEKNRLRENQEIVTKTLETLPVMVFVKDIKNEFRFSVWNSTAERIVGLKADDCLGKNDYDLFPKEQADFFRAKDQEALKTHEVIKIPEEELNTESGKTILRTRKAILRDANGNPAFLLGVSEDITAEKNAKDDLQKAKNHLTKLIELVPAGIFETDKNGSYVFVNDTWTKLTGYGADQAKGYGWLRAVHPDDVELVTKAWKECISERKPFDLVYRFRRPDGSILNVHGRSDAVYDASGEVTEYLGSIQDMTEQTKTRAELEKASSELNQFFYGSLDFLCIAGTDGKFKKINPTFNKILGYSEEELLSNPFLKFVHPNDELSTIKEFAKLAKGFPTTNFENRYICKDGSYRILSWSAFPDPSTGLIHGAARDITEIRKQELELHQTLEAINKSAIVAITDKKGIIIYANENFSKISGYSTEELIGNDHRIVNSGVHPKKFFRNLWKTISSGQVWSGEIENRTKQGQPYVVQTVISPLYNVTGKIDRYLAIRFDVTKQKESDRLLEEAQRVAKIGSWSYDIQSKEIWWSNQMYSIFPEDPSVGPPSIERHHSTIYSEDFSIWKSSVDKCVKDGKPYRIRFRTQFPNQLRWIEAFGEGKRDPTGRVTSLRGTCQDITELVEAEELAKNERAKAVQNSKLASLGEMSAGIAHEINNPLAIISGNTKILQNYINDHDKFQHKIESIEKASERIAKIVNGLRKFSRSSEKNHRRVHELSAIINEAILLTSAKARRHFIDVSLDCTTHASIECDEIEIEQVLVNLINNAIDAVKNLDEKWLKIVVFEDQSLVVAQISDSGRGIPPAVREKLFQPFFTTKPVGEGTGLGLSIVKGILDDHNAKIDIKAESLNTCFEIRFQKAGSKNYAA